MPKSAINATCAAVMNAAPPAHFHSSNKSFIPSVQTIRDVLTGFRPSKLAAQNPFADFAPFSYKLAFLNNYGHFAALISATVGALTRVNCITIVLPSSVMVIVAVSPVMIKGTEASAIISIPFTKV